QAEAQEIQTEAKKELDQKLHAGAKGIERMRAEERGVEEELGALRPLVESRMAELGNDDSALLDPEVQSAADVAFRKVEERMRTAVAGFLVEERRRGEGSNGGPDLPGFARGVETAIGDVMGAERVRLLGLLHQVFGQKTALLERRLSKLK